MKKTGRAVSPQKKNNSRPGNIARVEEPRSRLSFWLRLVSDLIMGAVILGVFYLFLEILPQYQQFQKMKAAMSADTATEVTATVKEPAEKAAEVSFDSPEEKALPTAEPLAAVEPAVTAEPAVQTAAVELENETATEQSSGQAAEIETLDASGADTAETELEENAETVPLSELFAEFFTEETVKDKFSYSSPNISIQITKVKDEEHGSQMFNAYIADIHLTETRIMQTGFPDKKTATADVIAKDNGAILAVNGDFYLNINKGILIRNGTVLQGSEGTSDICVIYQDGTMKTFGPGEYSVEGILNQNPWQVWSFGPALLDEYGDPKTEFNTSNNIYNRNPRTAIGYFEPGHYCLVTIDGRSEGNSNGATIRALAAMMADLGCRAAYNLDGGDSSIMVFDGKTVNKPSGGGRKLSDIVMICELPTNEEAITE